MKKLDDIKLIALDMDGTLLNGSSKISSRTKKVLHKLIDSGYEIVIATGRNYKEATRLTGEFSTFHYITSNGSSLINKNGEILIEKHFSKELLEDIMALFKKYNLINCAFLTKDEIVVEDKEKFYEDYIDLYKRHAVEEEFELEHAYQELDAKNYAVISDVNDKVSEIDKNIQKVYFSGDEKELKLLNEDLIDVIDENLNISATGVNLEINLGNISKGNALKKLVEHLDISLDEMIAFGDSENDIAMLEAAGISVVMKNSHFKYLKEKADIIAPRNDEDGVAEVLSKLI